MLALGSQASELPGRLQAADFESFPPEQVRLGQMLFYDPILSGNLNIACATCHNPLYGTSDGLSLGIGEGGRGVGPNRSGGEGKDRIRQRLPRNAPALWNLGAQEIAVLFHDGRVSISDRFGNEFDTPVRATLPEGLDSVLAAQALVVLASPLEMAGDPDENAVARAVETSPEAAWPLLADRVRAIPGYVDLFRSAYADVDAPDDIGSVQIANALAAFVTTEFQSFDSPFDAYLAGNTSALTTEQRAGMELFIGKARCAACHSGPLLTDQSFHALALPQFGPGRTRRWDPIARDVGRMAATDRQEDAYRFRTPSLRNVALTGPYGHTGAYATLEGVVRHHLDPRAGLDTWEPSQVVLPGVPGLSATEFLPLSDRYERARLAAAVDIVPVALSDIEIAQIVAFLHALTGTASVNGRLKRPDRVPSGLEAGQ